VTILPLLAADQLLMIRNFRFAVDETLLELPAGTLEPGEDPLQAAGRELTEETGYRAQSIDFVQAFWMSPGILRERMHLYLARNLTAGKMGLDAGEQIEPVMIALADALDRISDGQIQDAKTIVGLLWYDRWLREAQKK
jgi:ADP-ribose pyrophosphatase